jgi:ubiquinone/menaquinone biosynthesis C-methylase UbiE
MVFLILVATQKYKAHRGLSMKSTEKFVTEAFQEMAPDYERKVDGELKRFWGISYGEFVTSLLNHFTPGPDESVLDVATGTCVIPRSIIKKFQSPPRIFGLDLTRGMLRYGVKNLKTHTTSNLPALVNANAMQMPFSSNSFNWLICGLATHHMNPPIMLAEMHRVLKNGGNLLLADVGGADNWSNPIIKWFIGFFTLIYFSFVESYSRAQAELSALPNIYTIEQWKHQLNRAGFCEIEITTMNSRYFWIPKPLIIQAKKNLEGRDDINA